MKCRAGDLAVVVSAVNKNNIGRIVRVLRPYEGGDGLVPDPSTGPQWLVRCSVLLLWGLPGKRKYRRKQGPVGDAQLQPIRGVPGKRSRSVVISTSMSSQRVRIELSEPLTLTPAPIG